MSFPIKLGVGTLLLGSAVGVGYGAVNYFSSNKEDSTNEPQKTSVKDLIEKQYEYILLDTSVTGTNKDSKHWEGIWTTYQSKTDNEANPLQLDGWATRNSANFTDKIKEKCTGLSSLMILNEDEKPYKDVTKYCARNVTIKDQADKDKLVAIDTESSVNTAWENVASKAKDLTTHFANLGIKASPGPNITADNVKKGCKDALGKDKSKQDYNTTYNSFKEVCITKG